LIATITVICEIKMCPKKYQSSAIKKKLIFTTALHAYLIQAVHILFSRVLAEGQRLTVAVVLAIYPATTSLAAAALAAATLAAAATLIETTALATTTAALAATTAALAATIAALAASTAALAALDALASNLTVMAASASRQHFPPPLRYRYRLRPASCRNT
jgi:hypothetical protein